MRLSFMTLLSIRAVAASWKQVPHRFMQVCADCHENSPGTQCQARPGDLCWDLIPQTGQCPPGTMPCVGVLETVPTCKDMGRDVIDQGCNDTYPVCVHANGGEAISGAAGDHCARCINSIEPNDADQVDPDEGCNEINRVCVGDRQLAANVEGTACAVCFNSFPTEINPNQIDDGCPPSTPFCVNDVGDSPALWSPGTACVAYCFDTSLSDADEGCPFDFPICTLEDGSDPGANRPGVNCALCSPMSCDDQDPCTDDSCDSEMGCMNEDNGTCLEPEDEPCENAVDFTCSVPVPFCPEYPTVNGFGCVCDVDVDGTPFCWRDDFCAGLAECDSNDDCEVDEKCASTCCGGGHCLLDCALTRHGSRTRQLNDGEGEGNLRLITAGG